MHCVLELPSSGTDFATRCQLIKAGFSKVLPATKRRYWEHLNCDEQDYRAHLAYLHFNPVKYGHVRQVTDGTRFNVPRPGGAWDRLARLGRE
jgi:putative transposase